ncbi:MAG: ligase [Actinobacteria bacterium]|nr:ligase [Actinomycetota bacterium]
MRRLAPARCTAGEALAETERLLRSLRPGDAPVVVVWDVPEPALVMGRSAASSTLDVAAERLGIPVARRGTGGGPVLWDEHLLAVDVLLPKGHPLALTDVVASYRWVGDAGAETLRSIGQDALRLDPDAARAWPTDPSDPVSELCFAGVSPHEVVVGKRKAVGLSQARRATGTLIQIGIPLAPPGPVFAPLLPLDARWLRRLGPLTPLSRAALELNLLDALERRAG